MHPRRLHTLGLGIVEEQFYDIDVLRARERVTANSDDKRLAKPDVRRLRDGLVRECARARHDTCAYAVSEDVRDWLGWDRDEPMRPGLWMAPGWMPILQPSGLMIPGQLGPTRRDFDWLFSAFITYARGGKRGGVDGRGAAFERMRGGAERRNSLGLRLAGEFPR